uniref:Uncharacterized protein n=1 Tax=Anguilla anguilla TaxID=7936 RepID=A0A0E9SRE7_ANGAN
MFGCRSRLCNFFCIVNENY